MNLRLTTNNENFPWPGQDKQTFKLSNLLTLFS
jgi:hypothetical protein